MNWILLPVTVAALLGGPGGASESSTVSRAVTAAGSDDELDAALAALRDPSEARRAAAVERLIAGGAEAGLRALVGFGDATLGERRARASVARRAGGPGSLPLALEHLDDPDPAVRRELCELVGRGDLAARANERVQALAGAVRGDADRSVRSAALAGLARLEDPEATRLLCAFALELPPEEARLAAALAADLPGNRAWLVKTVQAAFDGPSAARALPAAALSELLSAYGRALAETPGGGERRADRAPFALGGVHPDASVRRAALVGWNGFLARNRALGQEERSRSVLVARAGEGMDAREAHYRRAHAALTAGNGLDVALESARALVQGVSPDAPVEERVFLFYGHYFIACAELAAGRSREALEGLDRAGRVLRALRAERVELRPHLADPSEIHAAAAVDHAVFATLVEVTAVLAHLAAGVDVGDARVRERAARAYRAALEAHLLAVDTGAPVVVSNWDAVLGDNVSPLVLVLGGDGVIGRARALELSVALGRALAAEAPLELPGFLDEDGAHEDAPLADEDLRELLTEILRAERRRVLKRRNELDGARRSAGRLNPARPAMRALDLRVLQLGRQIEEVRRGELGPLRTLRLPSDLALLLTRESLALGDTAGARELAERALADLDGVGIWEPYYWKQRLAARLEVAIGSSHMDEGDPAQAEELYERALGRHEGLENAFRQRAQEAADDPGQRMAYEAEARQSRLDQSNVLVSLAVNANVRWRDSERALGYFERAYELQRNEFMQVLLACYRARSGRDAEARAELRQITVSPGLYYNLACTHALLGDHDVALDFLSREFAENHPEASSLARQRTWAAGDPDLASLRDDPRFRRLVALDD